MLPQADGKLVAAPNLTSMPDVDRVEYGLTKVHLREWLGYAWVCLADEPPSFEDDVLSAVTERLGTLEAIDGYEIDQLSVGKRIVYDVKANWKLIIENFMECYHCATIHPELTEVLPEFADGYAAQYFVGHGAEFGEEVQGFTVDGSEGFDRAAALSQSDAANRQQAGLLNAQNRTSVSLANQQAANARALAQAVRQIPRLLRDICAIHAADLACRREPVANDPRQHRLDVLGHDVVAAVEQRPAAHGTLELPEGAKVDDALAALGDLAEDMPLVMAVNREYAPGHHVLSAGDDRASHAAKRSAEL